MLKTLVNESIWDLDLEAIDPLLVKAGGITLSGPDAQWLETRNRKGEAVQVIPGTTLKGAFRAHGEKILRTLNLPVCNPFVREGADRFCGRAFDQRSHGDKKVSPSEAYADSCPACRLFGSTHFIGRFQSADAVPDRKLLTESRDGVGIDRISGGAYPGAKFEYSVVPAGSVFRTRIAIQNFEMWQMGLLALTLRDFMGGFIRIGSGKTRGLGGIKAHLTGWHLYQFGKSSPGREMRGIGAQLGQTGKAYRLVDGPDSLNLSEALGQSWQREGLRWSLAIPAADRETVLASLSEIFVACAEGGKLPRVAQ